MAINKNFVVKNGLEVKSNLIVADGDTNKVGVGTTSAEYKLHVLGGIGATDVIVSSALTATVADIGDLTVNGIGATTLIVSGISTFTGAIDANGDLDVDGHTELDNLRVSGVSTFVGIATFQGDLYVGGDLYVADDVFYDEVSGRNLNISGVGTIANFVSPVGNISDLTSASIGSTNINITGVGTFAILDATDGIVLNLNVTGVGSIATLDVPTGSIDYLTSINLETSGITTLSSSGGITTTGGDLYVGQDLYFAGDLYQNGEIFTSGIGIQTGDTLIGSGVTFIEFRGPGVSTGYYNASVGIATIFFQGGGGGGGGSIGIGSAFPATPLNGDLFFHIDYGRTFIYYNESTLGVGSSAFWVDSSPFNIGIITALYGGVSFSDGTAVDPSWYFQDDIATGVYSPTNGELTFVSTGSSILNINSSGVVVTGVVTASTVYANGQELLRGVGIATEGGYVGSGATVIDFRGPGISTVAVSSGIATVNVIGGGSGGGAFSAVNYIIN